MTCPEKHLLDGRGSESRRSGRHGLCGSAGSPLVRRHHWDEQRTSKWVWPSSCRGQTEERPDGMSGGEQAQPTSVGWDFRGGTSCGGANGIASKLLTCMHLPPTNLNVCRLRHCLGQPLKESAGEKPISETCGRPASWSSLKTTRKSEKSPTEAKRTQSARGDSGAEKESAVAERTVSAGRQERGGQKPRRTVSEGVTATGALADIEPAGGTRSVDPMPARGRADGAKHLATLARRAASGAGKR